MYRQYFSLHSLHPFICKEFSLLKFSLFAKILRLLSSIIVLHMCVHFSYPYVIMCDVTLYREVLRAFCVVAYKKVAPPQVWPLIGLQNLHKLALIGSRISHVFQQNVLLLVKMKSKVKASCTFRKKKFFEVWSLL